MMSSSDSSSLGIKIVTFRAQHQFVLDCWVKDYQQVWPYQYEHLV
jgi:hypothetical protein